MISILVATRRNSPLLTGFLYNIADHTFHPENVEIIVSLSDKDTINEGVILDFQRYSPIKVVIVRNDKSLGRIGLHFYMNDCAKQSKGDFLWHMCDDYRLLTYGYDEIIEQQKPLSDQVYSFVPIGSGGVDGFIAPMITRRWYEVLGHWAMGSSVDSWIGELQYAIDRKIVLEVRLEDLTYTNPLCFPRSPRTDADNDLEKEALYLSTNSWDMPPVRDAIKKDIELLKQNL